MTIEIDGPIFPFQSISFNRIPELKRTQQILLFLISLVFSIYILSFITIIYSLSINYRTNTYEPIVILGWILFFAFGLFVTQRYYPTGLLIFAWLGILNVILTCILIVFVTVGIVIITSHSPRQLTGMLFTASPIVACLICVILDAVIVIFSFKLWYLIRRNLHPPNHHQRI